MHRPASVAVLVLVAGCALAASASGRQPDIAGPHDARPDFEPEDAWLPRHRALLQERGIPGGPEVRRTAPSRALRFRRPVRVSTDLAGPPPPELTTAQAETQTEPYLAANPADPRHLVAGWQENRFTDGGARALGVAVSRDGGRRWKEQLLPGLTPLDGGTWDRASDPWMTFGPDDSVYFASLLVTSDLGENAVAVSVSQDGGSTWGAPVEVAHDVIDFNDKEAIVADAVDSSPFRGNVYLAWDANVPTGSGAAEQHLLVARSTNGGKSWRPRVTVRVGQVNIGVVPVVGPDGSLNLLWGGADSGDTVFGLWFARSDDGGASFSEPQRLHDLLATGVPGYRSGSILPSLAVDPVTGDLFAAWPDSRFTGVDQATISISRDGGRTWSVPARVSDGASDAASLTVGVAANAAGHIAVGYYELPSDPADTRVHHRIVVSEDGGGSFSPSVRTTRRPFDARFGARANTDLSIMLGDYLGLVGTDDGFVALWTGTYKRSRLGAGRQPDIYAARSR